MKGTEAMAASYNLHLHTHWSYDGEVAPEAYLKRATELGMRCIAFTDHDNIDVRRDLGRLAPQYPRIRAVLGALPTTVYHTRHGLSRG